MSHIPNILDVKTDLRRSVLASYSKKQFNDVNVKTFVDNAQKNLELIKESLGKRKYLEVKQRIAKSQNPQKSLENRREDLLTASSLI
jgi:hypothetical protein